MFFSTALAPLANIRDYSVHWQEMVAHTELSQDGVGGLEEFAGAGISAWLLEISPQTRDCI